MAIVYQHRRLDTNEVFYIGIGKDIKRAYSKCGRNKYWKDIVNKYGYQVDILIDGCDYKSAIKVEIGMISSYGRKNLGQGCLVNMTNGGQTKQKISDAKKGKKYTEEHKEKMSNSIKNYWIIRKQNKKI
jgi:hypothetical protein